MGGSYSFICLETSSSISANCSTRSSPNLSTSESETLARKSHS